MALTHGDFVGHCKCSIWLTIYQFVHPAVAHMTLPSLKSMPMGGTSLGDDRPQAGMFACSMLSLLRRCLLCKILRHILHVPESSCLLSVRVNSEQTSHTMWPSSRRLLKPGSWDHRGRENCMTTVSPTCMCATVLRNHVDLQPH